MDKYGIHITTLICAQVKEYDVLIGITSGILTCLSTIKLREGISLNNLGTVRYRLTPPSVALKYGCFQQIILETLSPTN